MTAPTAGSTPYCDSRHEGYLCARPVGHSGKHRHSLAINPQREVERLEAALAEALRLMRKYPPDAAGPDLDRFLRAHPAPQGEVEG